MLISCLKLNNFRNYSACEFAFSQNKNIIIGKNGVGKTNILEALIFVSNTKSFRTGSDSDLIKKECEYSRIEVKSEDKNYRVVINKEGKSLFINNEAVKKSSEFIGKLNCVLFKPSDLELFNQSPKERRKLLDVEIGKVSKEYLDSLLRYNLLLKDKNRLLKEDKIDLTYLMVIEEQMIPHIKTIITKRQEFFDFINRFISDYYYKIANDKKEIKVDYHYCCKEEDVEKNIQKNHDKDFNYHYAVFGPHHDDYEFMMNNYPLNTIASQGQTRMVTIAFKLALVEYIKNKTGKTPILLLDDILSELDINNRERLIKVIPEDLQVIITGTDLNGLNIKENYKLIELKEA